MRCQGCFRAFRVSLLSMDVGSRIKAWREARNLTQQQLGAICGVSRQSVSQWESGETKSLRLENFFTLCDNVFHCEPRELMFGEDGLARSTDQTFIAAVWDRLPIGLRRLVVAVVLYSCPNLERRKSPSETLTEERRGAPA